MLIKKAFWILAALGLLVHVAIAAENDPIVGRSGGHVVKKSDLDRLIQYYPPDRQKLIQESPDQMTALVERMLEVKILSDLAKKAAVDQKIEVKEQLQYLADNFLAQEYVFRFVVKEIRIPDEEIKKFYQENEKSFVNPEQVRVKHILIKCAQDAPQDEKKKARENAEAVLKRVKAGEDFSKLAQEVSDDAGSKQNGGELGYFGRGQVVKPFEDAAFSLKSGQTSGVVETPFGFHILKVEDHKAAINKSYEEVKEAIRSRLQDQQAKEKVDEFIKKKMKEIGIEVYRDKISIRPKKN
jgi:peptidyl-prolyl cis-trans isomerase C